MKDILKQIEESLDQKYITLEESWVSGFDPDTKKGFKACTRTWSYFVLLGYGNNKYILGERVKTIFDDQTTLGWHWKNQIPGDIKSFEVLPKFK